MLYLKEFNTYAEYEEYASGSSYKRPNVSRCIDESGVHYNYYPPIVAKFNVTSTSEPTQILNRYTMSAFTGIEIDGVVQSSVVSAYTFDTTGEHTVKYVLKDKKTIENSAFSYCSNLASVTIPDSVTSIGEYAFGGCSSLTSIDIPSGVTSIGNGAFSYCTGLTSITIPDNVTSIGDYAFENCSGLTSVTIPDSVISIGSDAFWNCSGLTSITIPYSVTSIGNGAFQGCSGLINIVVNSGNSVYDSRNNCNAIIETSTNTLIKGCKNTIIPNDVIIIGQYSFINCSGLTSVVIPDSVTSIGSDAFAYCHSLASVTIGSGLTEIGYMIFESCNNLVTLTINSNNQKYDSRNNCNAIIETSTNRLVLGCKSTIIPNTITSIGSQAFSYVEITDIVIPDSVTTIESYAFENCNSLTGITIGSGVTSISGGYGFINNNLIKVTTNSLVFPMAEEIVFGDSITNIPNNKFYYYSKLKKVTIGKNVTNIGSNAFRYCNGLTNITSLATTAPTIQSDTFQNIKTNGTLTVPSASSGYDVWMGTGDYYLGKYNWTKVEQ